MEKIKLYDGELKLMELLWEMEGATSSGPSKTAGTSTGTSTGTSIASTPSTVTAKELALLASDKIGWNKNTTYTVIKKLVAKGAIKRMEPDFVCCSLITRQDVGRHEAKKVLKSFFGGSAKALFSSFMADGTLSAEEADELRKLIDEHTRKE